MPIITTRPLALVTAVTTLVLTLAACSSAGVATTDAPSGSGGGGSADFQTALDTAYKGVVPELPTSTPKPPTGKSVWIVSCGQQAAACVSASASAKKAAEAIGWTAQVCDGKLNPQTWGDCIRQGTAAKVDVTIPISVDCPVVTQPLKEAAAAGIKTVSAGGLDCSEKVYSSAVQFLPEGGLQAWYEGIGKVAADYAIARAEGKASVLLLNFTDALWGPMLTKGFTDELKTCAGCKVARTLDLGNQDLIGGTLASKFSTALLQGGDANAVFVPLDIWMVLGLGQAIQSSGKSSTLTVVGAFGDGSNMDLVRQGKETASVNYDPVHYGYAAIDESIRVLAGAPSVSQGVGYQLVDKDHNLPASGPYVESRDIPGAYTKLWGLG